jgi:hypothetical protein
VSLTVHQKPDNNSPAYNDLNFVVSESSLYTNPNFKFIADVFQNTTRIARLKAPIYPNSTNKGVFNISRLIENFVTFDWDIDDTSASGCPNSYLSYKVNFGYEYSTGSTSPIIEVSGATNVTGLTAYNMALNPIDFVSFDEGDYLNTSNTAKFLTSIRTKTIHRNQKDWLYFWRGNAGSVEIKTYPAETTQIILLSGITDSVVRVPIIPSSGATYIEVVTKGTGGAKSETYTINIKDECSKYTDNDVYFLNRLGGIESFRFNRVRKDNFSVTRKQFKKSPYTLSGTDYSYETSSQNNSNYYTESSQKITLNSNWITEAESIWLKDLVMSPMIWIKDNGVLKAINITNTDYAIKTLVNDKVFNLTIECELSFVDKVQRL